MTSITSGVNPKRVSLLEQKGKIRIEIDGQLFTEYRYEGYAKPILYPILGPHQISMTRHYPMRADVAGEANDHPHHKSMWFSHGNVNGVDFWEEKDSSGKIVHEELLHATEDTSEATIRAANTWFDSHGNEVCRDKSTLIFAASSNYRTIDWITTLHTKSGELTFRDTKEGTMGIRMHPNLRLDASRRSEGLSTARAVNSSGVHDRDVWGKRAEWIDYWGTIDDQTVGIAIFDHPQNPRHPTWWHAREYGLAAANPFGIHDFEGKPQGTGDLVVPRGETLTFRYRFVFHCGDYQEAKISKLYKKYSQKNQDNRATTESMQ